MSVVLLVGVGLILAGYACFVIASDEDDKNGND